MTVATYRLKLTRTNALKLRVSTRIPAQLEGGTGTSVTRANGAYTVDLDFSEFGEIATYQDALEATTYIPSWESLSNSYSRQSITNIKADFATTFGGLYQPLDATLTALSALDSTAGLLTQTGADTFVRRTLTGTANEITVANGSGAGANPTFSLPSALVFSAKTVTGGEYISSTITGPDLNGGTVDSLTSFSIRSTGAAFDLLQATSEAISANRTISWNVGNANRSITLGGNLSLAANLTTSGAFASTFTMTGTTTVTFPTSGTLATTGNLSQFAATTSTQLAGVISDETGSGSLVFASAPTLTNPVVGTQSPGDNSTKAASTAYVEAAVAAGGGALNGPISPGGRLTLTSGTPVMATSVSSATTLYYTPSVGNLVPIYNGSSFAMTAFTELSIATTDTTKNPAAIGATKVNDWFVWNDSGTLRLSHGPDWTNDTTRSAGTALTVVKGVPLNNASITNGPAASRGTYVGTTRSDGSSTLNFIYGALGAGGVAGNFGVWNAYNRVPVSTIVRDSTNTWTYGTATTWREANAPSAMHVLAVRGLDIDPINATYCAAASAGASSIAACGVGVNSTTAFSGTTAYTGSTSSLSMAAKYSGLMGLGYVYVAALEYNLDTTAATWIGDLNSSFIQTGLHVELWQ